MMTVKEVFEQVYGTFPDHVTGCYVSLCGELQPVITTSNKTYLRKHNEWISSQFLPEGPDISNENAYSFRGFFGPAFTSVLTEKNNIWRK